MKVPELRFPEFEGEWEYTELKNISKEIKRTSEECSESILTISAGRGFIDQQERWNKVMVGNSLKKYILLKKNEFSYNRGNSKTFPYGCIYRLKDHESALVPYVYRSFALINQNPLFYEQFFIGGHIHRQLIKLISSSARMDGLLNISKKDFFDVEVPVPSLEEQEKIGVFLSKIDKKIEKLEKKSELWQSYKKGMMQQLFSQKLRFKDDDGKDYPDWEERKFGNICLIQMGQSPSSKNYTENPENTLLIQGNADLKNGKIIPRLYTTEITKTSKPGDIIMTVRAPVGDLAFNDYLACIGRGVCAIKGNRFIYYLLEHLRENKVWNRISQGSTFESISSADIKNLKIQIPSLSEQTKIANFLSAIDKKIESITQELEINKEFKKGLLQQMFPSDKKSEDIKTKDLSKLDKQSEQTALL